MTNFIWFALLGIGSGAIYALAGQGLVLIYRGSGVLNFAHGAMALLAAGIFTELTQSEGFNAGPAAIVAVAVTALLGYLIELLIMRRLHSASPLARLVAILGVLGVVQSLGVHWWGGNNLNVNSFLPSEPLHIASGIVVSEDRFLLLGIAAGVTAILWAVYRYTSFGRWTTAVAENRRSASSAGVSPNFVASVNWGLGGALAGLAGVLIVPITGLDPLVLTLLILPTLAAAMVGNFSSFPLTLLGGVGIGVGISLLSNYVSEAGWSQSLPFLVIIAVIVIRGNALPIRGYTAFRLPAVSSARINWWLFVVTAGIGFLLIANLSTDAVAALLTTFITALLCLSLVVVTGLAGQLSLGQLAFAGMGAFVSAQLSEFAGLSFVPALLVGVACAIPMGLVFGLPAVRTRGVNLAIVTLGLGFAIDNIVLLNASYTNGYTGLVVKHPTLFGWSIYSITQPRRYAAVALVLFLICAVGVINLRRGRAGRRLLATRANERAAASIGISAVGAKLFAFSLSAAIAAVAGVLSAFQYPNVDFNGFDSFSSIQLILLVFLGGVGYVSGSLVAGALALGGILTYAISTVVNFSSWEGVITSALLILTVLTVPSGAMNLITQYADRGATKVRSSLTARRSASTKSVEDRQVAGKLEGAVTRCEPRTLTVEGVSVRFGGVVALSDVSLTVGPGEVVGLIGPNGAGKTTMIDAITGYNRLASGSVQLDGVDFRKLPAFRRARLGVTRTFQNLELFEDMTVGDNLRAACDSANRLAYLTDLVYPKKVPLPEAALRALDEFGLSDDLGRKPDELSFGSRRLLGLARAVASRPSILLLDEPAAGLDEVETAELGRAVRRLAEDWGIGVLLVEHDMSLVMQVTDRVVVLNFGEKIREGTPEFIRNDESVKAAYLGSSDDLSKEAAAVEAPG